MNRSKSVASACLAGACVALDGYVVASEHLANGGLLHLCRLPYPHLMQASLQRSGAKSVYRLHESFGCMMTIRVI